MTAQSMRDVPTYSVQSLWRRNEGEPMRKRWWGCWWWEASKCSVRWSDDLSLTRCWQSSVRWIKMPFLRWVRLNIFRSIYSRFVKWRGRLFRVHLRQNKKNCLLFVPQMFKLTSSPSSNLQAKSRWIRRCEIYQEVHHTPQDLIWFLFSLLASSSIHHPTQQWPN